MPSSKRLAPDKARDRRAKIILGVLGVVLLAVLGFELPGMLGGSGSGSSSAAGTTNAGTTLAAATTAATTAVQTPSGQLASFTRFPTAKNPFHALANAATTATTTSTPPAGKTAKSGKQPGKIPTPPLTLSVEQTTTSTTTTQTGPLVPAAVFQLNGVKRVMTVGATFPATRPVFKLLAVGQKTMWLQLVNGSLTDGAQTIVVHFGKPLKLVNQTAKLHYLLRFMKPTVAPPPPPVATKTPASSTATTTAPSTTAQTATVSAASP